mmetsp:Transcript_103389/g.267404  ORF Transcript_103389/g.267404 Transcript_103389/m.267404 type:complete len:514 (+) Transcript_103389:150-1691(+)
MPLIPTYTDAGGDSSTFTRRSDLKHAVLPHERAIYVSFAETFAPYLAEMVGTFILTMTFMCNYGPSADPVWAATSNAFMVAALVYAFYHVSGANLNPSVSIALIFAGRHTPRVAMRLCFAQTIGAVLAALLRMQVSAHTDIDIGPFYQRSWSQVGLVEVLYTAMISFTYLNCAASIRNNPVGNQNGFIGLAMGFCYIASGYASRHISNSVTNPAIAIGLAIVDSRTKFNGTGLWYFVYDIFGALLGASAYRVVRPTEVANPESMDGPEDKDPISAQVAAEFIGTFYLVFTKALNRLGMDAHSETNLGPEAWSVAAVISAMVYSLKGVSGACFNPSVSLAMWMCGKSTGRVAAVSATIQVLAGVTAMSLYAALAREGISIRLDREQTMGAIAFAETAFTFLLCYVVLGTGAVGGSGPKSRPNNVAGLTYGACHTVGGFAIGNVSGSLLNPAVVAAFGGLNILTLQWNQGCFVYIFYEVFGALLASLAYTATHTYAAINAARLKDEDRSTPRPAA